MNQEILKHKQEMVAKITDLAKKSQSIVIAEYRGLTVAELTELRRELRKNKATMNVYKNTLVNRAFNDLKLDLNELHSCQDEECKKSYKRYNWWKNDAKCCEDCIYRLKKNNGLYDYNDCSIDEVIFVFECWLLKQNL